MASGFWLLVASCKLQAAFISPQITQIHTEKIVNGKWLNGCWFLAASC